MEAVVNVSAYRCDLVKIIGEGDADAAKSIALIKESGYDGFITVEFEGAEDNLVGIRHGLANLRRFWQA